MLFIRKAKPEIKSSEYLYLAEEWAPESNYARPPTGKDMASASTVSFIDDLNGALLSSSL